MRRGRYTDLSGHRKRSESASTRWYHALQVNMLFGIGLRGIILLSDFTFARPASDITGGDKRVDTQAAIG